MLHILSVSDLKTKWIVRLTDSNYPQQDQSNRAYLTLNNFLVE